MELQAVAELLKNADPLLRTIGLGITFALISYRWLIWAYAAARSLIRLVYLLRHGSPTEVRAAIDEKPPEVPKGTGFLAVAALAISATLIAPITARLLTDAASCPRKCPDGQECVEGGNGRRYCGKLAKPAERPASPPESAVSYRETPAYYRRNPLD